MFLPYLGLSLSGNEDDHLVANQAAAEGSFLFAVPVTTWMHEAQRLATIKALKPLIGKKVVINKQKIHENMRWHSSWHGVCDNKLMYVQTVGTNLLSMLWRPQEGNRGGLARNVALTYYFCLFIYPSIRSFGQLSNARLN